jgi:hypothetical protein
MTYAFSQNEHPFGQCGHFNQVEPLRKPWFFVVNGCHPLVDICSFFINTFIQTYDSCMYNQNLDLLNINCIIVIMNICT